MADAIDPVHLCTEKQHGVLIHEPDGDHYDEVPLCHDCGGDLVRPPGKASEAFVCGRVHRHPSALTLKAGVLECGIPR